MVFKSDLFLGKRKWDYVGDENSYICGWWNGNLHGSYYSYNLWSLVSFFKLLIELQI